MEGVGAGAGGEAVSASGRVARAAGDGGKHALCEVVLAPAHGRHFPAGLIIVAPGDGGVPPVGGVAVSVPCLVVDAAANGAEVVRGGVAVAPTYGGLGAAGGVR